MTNQERIEEIKEQLKQLKLITDKQMKGHSGRPGVVTSEMIEEHRLQGELKWREGLKKGRDD